MTIQWQFDPLRTDHGNRKSAGSRYVGCKGPARAIATWIVVFTALLGSAGSYAEYWRKGSSWMGMLVITPDGARVGQVQDFALDLPAGKLNYVVVAVGSFLIEDSLIAVAPEALSLRDGRLVLRSDNIASARRFAEDNWPLQPDVLASDSKPDSQLAGDAGEADELSSDSSVQPGTALPSSGLATISSSRRTATLSAEERRIEDIAPAARSSAAIANSASSGGSRGAPVANGPLPRFGVLDSNRNGVLSRREIGPWLSRQDGYDTVDLDASGTVDRFEYDVFAARRKQ